MALDFYFLNVGHGDCTVIDFPDRLTVVDINDVKGFDPSTEVELFGQNSPLTLAEAFLRLQGQDKRSRFEKLLTDPVEFIIKNFRNRGVFRFIATHPDLDHISGLVSLFGFGIYSGKLTNFWTTDHLKEIGVADFSRGKYKKYKPVHWDYFRALESGVVIRTDNENYKIKVLKLEAGSKNKYYADDRIDILAPTPCLIEKAKEQNNYNIASYVLRIQYGSCVIILGGDATVETWEDILNRYSESYLKCNLLKASHHGRGSGYLSEAVATMDPDNVVISVGKKPENDAQQKYRNYTKNVFSTRFHGTIKATCWLDGDVWLYDHRDNRIN